LNRHGRRPLPPQDSVSTKFHHFGTYWRADRCLFGFWFRLGIGLAGCRGRGGRLGRRRACLRIGFLFDGRRGLGHDGFTPGAVADDISQRQGGEHEDDRRRRGHLAEKRGRPGASEQRLARAAAEGRPQVGALAGLEQDDHDQRHANDNMYHNE